MQVSVSALCFNRINTVQTLRQWSVLSFDGVNTVQTVVSVLLWRTEHSTDSGQCSCFEFDGLDTVCVQTVVSAQHWWTRHSTDSGQCSALRIDSDTQYFNSGCDLGQCPALTEWTQYREWSVFYFDRQTVTYNTATVHVFVHIDSLGQCPALNEWTQYRGWSVFYFGGWTVTYNTVTAHVSRQSRSVPCFDWVNTVQRTVSVLLWWMDSDIQYCDSATVHV